ncbi:MAG TPA: MauE/DoxX family redox-associated membrane protein [Candidatus Saccharimonadia bacterium]|nr:MauE/DoxX family redox-associated membrane protein [Candidatus Saccharimonadia bacterium]
MFTSKSLNKPYVSQILLRLGLAFVFAYAGVGSLRDPNEWIGYLPHFLAAASYAHVLIKVFALTELGLATWLLSGKFVRYAAAASALMLGGIVLANPADLIITFRDVGLACMALALVFAV